MSSIEKELVAENTSLREEVKKLKEQNLNYTFQIISLEKPIKIRGVLIAEGVWKGIKYSYDEMKKILDKFEKIPILIDHGHTEQFGTTPVGQILKVEADDMLRSLVFEGEVTDDKAIELTTSKTLDAISIKGEFKNIDTTQAPPIGLDYSPIEASLTSSPACDVCYIFNYELSNFLHPIKEEKPLNDTITNSNVGDIKMTDNLEEEIFIEEDQLLVTPELAEDGEFEFELIKESEWTEELAKKKVGYKLYPGYYPKKAKKGFKKAGKYYPKYPYYSYYKYPYKKKLSEEEILDVLDLAESYRAFMKDCMKGGKDMAACATEWKSKKGATEQVPKEQPLDEFEISEQELAEKAKCPACGWEGKWEDFKKHWNKEHKEEYGQYKHAKKLMKKIIKDKELRSRIKSVYSLSEEPEPSVKPSEAPLPEKTEEEIIKELREPKKVADLLLKSEGK